MMPNGSNGRTSIDHIRDIQLATYAVKFSQDWKNRLSRVLSFPSMDAALHFEKETLLPALHDIAAEFSDQGISASVVSIRDGDGIDDGIELLAQDNSGDPFNYRVHRNLVPVPTYGASAVYSDEEYVRLDVRPGGMGRPYDIMGYTYTQIVEDVLDQYERHLDALRDHNNGTSS